MSIGGSSPYGDFLSDVSFGSVPGQRTIFARGNNPDIDIAPEDVWPGGGLYPWMATATSLEAVSTNAADAAAGTGARTITINGLDAAFAEISAVVTMNGLTPVAIPTQFFRINSASVTTAGTGLVNAGDILIRDAGAGTTRAIIVLGFGLSRQSQFTVPAGHSLLIMSLLGSINRPSSARDCAIATKVRVPTGGGAYTELIASEFSVDGNPFQYQFIPGPLISATWDFDIRCTFVSAANTDLTAIWSGILRRN